MLSVDGGYTFPFILLANTTNDGTQSVSFPSGTSATTQARVRIESACQTCVKFFDISNVDFSITSFLSTPSPPSLCTSNQFQPNWSSNLLNLGAIDFAYGTSFSTIYIGYLWFSSPQTFVYDSSSPWYSALCSVTTGLSYCTDKVRFKPSTNGTYTFNIACSPLHGCYSQLASIQVNIFPSLLVLVFLDQLLIVQVKL